MEESEIAKQQAEVLLSRAYRHQMQGELGEAIYLYRRSIALYPTPEAHTFLGWAYSMMSRYDEAINECEKAIALDPEFGNPYNDIGSYLIEMEQYEDALPWLEKALVAPRYESRQFPYINLARAYQELGDPFRALHCYDLALQEAPFYMPAEWGRNMLLGRLN